MTGFYHTNLSSPSKAPRPRVKSLPARLEQSPTPACLCQCHSAGICERMKPETTSQQPRLNNETTSDKASETDNPEEIRRRVSLWMKRGRPRQAESASPDPQMRSACTQTYPEMRIPSNDARNKHLQFDSMPTPGGRAIREVTSATGSNMQRSCRATPAVHRRAPSPFPVRKRARSDVSAVVSDVASVAETTPQHGFVRRLLNRLAVSKKLHQSTAIDLPVSLRNGQYGYPMNQRQQRPRKLSTPSLTIILSSPELTPSPGKHITDHDEHEVGYPLYRVQAESQSKPIMASSSTDEVNHDHEDAEFGYPLHRVHARSARNPAKMVVDHDNDKSETSLAKVQAWSNYHRAKTSPLS